MTSINRHSAPRIETDRRDKPPDCSDQGIDDRNWVIVADAEQLDDGEMISAEVGGVQVAIYNVGGSYFCTSNLCTHAYAELTNGYLEGHSVECPLHGVCFDIRSGKRLEGIDCDDLKNFPVRKLGTKLQIVSSCDGNNGDSQ